MTVWYIEDLNPTRPDLILITDGVREWILPKFRINMVVEEPLLFIYWNDRERGTGGEQRRLVIDYRDVADGYSGYVDNPASATALMADIEAMIISGFGGGGGDILTAKADLLSHDGVSDTILPGGTNEYILSRDNIESTGLKWISKTDIVSGGVSVSDSSTIDMTKTGADISADAKLSAVAGNILVDSTGLYVPSSSYLIGYNDNVTTTNTVAQEYICGVLIPGGTLAVGDLIVCKWGIKKTSGVGSMQGWAHLHTAAAIGGNFYGTGTLGATQGYQGEANILVTGAATQRGSAGAIAVYGTAFAADFTTSALNIANDMYVNILTQKSVGTDGGFVRYQTVEIIKKR